MGEVRAIGDITEVAVGDTVVFGKYSGTDTIDVDDETLLILELKDIKAVVYDG